MQGISKRRGTLVLTATIILVMSVAAGVAGAAYFYSSNFINNNEAPQVQVAGVADGKVLPAGAIEIKGAVDDDGTVQAVSIRIDGGPPQAAVPTVNDFSSWSVPLDLSPGNHTIEIETVDDSGRRNSKEISVVATPALEMPADLVVEASGPDGATVGYTIPAVQESIEISSGPDCHPAPGSIFPIGTTAVKCSVLFAGNNSAAYDFDVSVVDTTPPSLTVPPDATVENPGVAFMELSLGAPVVNDSVDASPVVTNNAPANGFALGTTLIVWAAEDDYGNVATAIQRVTVTAATVEIIEEDDEDNRISYSTGGGGGSGGGGSSGNSSHNEDDGSGGGNVPPQHTLTINAENLSGEPMDVSAIVKATDGAVLQTGSTPLTFTGNELTYEITVTDDDEVRFDHWEDGDADPTRQLTLSQDVAIVAYYNTSAAGDTAAPVATAMPAGGTYSSAQSVILSANEPATIYYTTNGNIPTTSSPVYNSPIPIASTTTLKYFARDASGNSGNMVAQTYTINTDTVPPTVVASPAGGTFNSAQSVTLTANEPASIYYTINGNNPTESSAVYSSPIAISATTTLKYFAKDAAENSGVVATQTYTISTPDTTGPSVEITNFDDGSTVVMPAGGLITVQGAASDNEGGSGIEVVEVRLDDSSYVEATPAAEGDWSSWSVTLEVTPGERRFVPRATDNAGNQAWGSIYVTFTEPSGGGDNSSLDDFGIEKLYPTVNGGNEWYVNMDDPYSDPLLQNRETLTEQSDGSWQVSGGSNDQVRLEAWSPANEKWLNVEMTMYAKMVSGSNELLQMYSRGGHHTSSNECLGSAYKARFYGDGDAAWVKEINHPAYAGNRGSVQATDTPLADRWIGLKAVIYNFVENGKTYVRLESYIDDDVTDSSGNLVVGNNWELASVVEDRGGWASNDSDYNSTCAPVNKDSTQQYRQRDEIINMSGGTSTQNIAAFRSDNLTWNWKYLSVREIAPPS